jgi:hypothetical protein
MAFTITGTKIVAVDLLDDPGRIAEADLADGRTSDEIARKLGPRQDPAHGR